MSSKRSLLFATLAICGLNGQAFSKEYPRDGKVVYGDDNRRDLFNDLVTAEQAEWSRSVAIMVRTSSLKEQEDGIANLPNKTYGETMKLCKNEAFYNQPSPGFCTGFLVGDDLMVTAGHCIRTKNDCESTALVFDFAYSAPDQNILAIQREQVFSCKEVLATKVDSASGLDYAVIRLDRSTNRPTLPIRSEGEIEIGAQLTMIGHPSGLPLKIADGAEVRDAKEREYFVATTDSFAGNSGSPVINSVTGEVEGILVRGEADFVRQGSCRVSKRCTKSECRGEDITRIAHVVSTLKTNTH